jgi:hypothetical protein
MRTGGHRISFFLRSEGSTDRLSILN